jgi:hypothetical protein
LQNLYGLNSAYLIKKPTATGKHEQTLALHLKQTNNPGALRIGDLLFEMDLEKSINEIRVSVKDYLNIFIPELPGINP